MRAKGRVLLLLASLLTAGLFPASPTAAQESKKEPSGAISGHVTLGGKPVPRAIVLASSMAEPLYNAPLPHRATADDNGQVLTSILTNSRALVEPLAVSAAQAQDLLHPNFNVD